MSCSTEVAEPLRTLPELLNWVPEQMTPALQAALAAVPPLPPVCSSGPSPSGPQTLVCHDMQGGYTDDRFLKGCSNSSAYRFTHWSGIDTFVYFSHHFITIPPPGWTAAAHTNGVTMLGTVITEATEGRALCAELFSSVGRVERAVQQLAAIARCHHLQGWLINIENKMEPVAVGLVLLFLQKLRQAMRAVDERACIVWYDSITHSGSLDWQDELNGRNSCFYEASDAIFLNYSWKELQLAASREYARSFPSRRRTGVVCSPEKQKQRQGDTDTRDDACSAGAATTSATDVAANVDSNSTAVTCTSHDSAASSSTSIAAAPASATATPATPSAPSSLAPDYDLPVVGRQEPVVLAPTEGEETKVFVGVDVFGRNFYEGGGFNTDKAMAVIRAHGLSAAVFAPGWTHETLGCQDFPANDAKFWRLLGPHLRQHGPSAWPVHTTFSQGCGRALYRQGQVFSSEEWFNLCEQSLLPDLVQECAAGCSVRLCDSDAYDGGSCLLISNSAAQASTVSLWSNCFLQCSEGAVELLVASKAHCSSSSSNMTSNISTSTTTSNISTSNTTSTSITSNSCSSDTTTTISSNSSVVASRVAASITAGADGHCRLTLEFSCDEPQQLPANAGAAAEPLGSNGWSLSSLQTPPVAESGSRIISAVSVCVPAGVALKLGLLRLQQVLAVQGAL